MIEDSEPQPPGKADIFGGRSPKFRLWFDP
jgi:hypothetical protein